MPRFIPLKEMEAAHAAYNHCSEELTEALTEARLSDRQDRVQTERIAFLSAQCDELMNKYLEAFKTYYGVAR